MNKKIQLESPNNRSASKMLAIYCIGLLVSWRNDCISATEAEGFFVPRTVKAAKDLNISSEVIELIELACELEDVRSLIPGRLKDNIDILIVKFSDYLNSTSKEDFMRVSLIGII